MPVAECRAREITTFAVYSVISHVPVLRNCFVIVMRGTSHEDSENTTFLEMAFRGFSVDIRVLKYLEIRMPGVESQIEIFDGSLFNSNLELKYMNTARIYLTTR